MNRAPLLSEDVTVKRYHDRHQLDVPRSRVQSEEWSEQEPPRDVLSESEYHSVDEQMDALPLRVGALPIPLDGDSISDLIGLADVDGAHSLTVCSLSLPPHR